MKITKMTNEQLMKKKNKLIQEYHKHNNKAESYKFLISELNDEQVRRLVGRLKTKVRKDGF